MESDCALQVGVDIDSVIIISMVYQTQSKQKDDVANKALHSSEIHLIAEMSQLLIFVLIYTSQLTKLIFTQAKAVVIMSPENVVGH